MFFHLQQQKHTAVLKKKAAAAAAAPRKKTVLPPDVPSSSVFSVAKHVSILPSETLKDESLDADSSYFYNASILRAPTDAASYVLAYRFGRNPPCHFDQIAACRLDTDLKVVPDSVIPLELHSNYAESTAGKLRGLPRFENGVHVEDPRIVTYREHIFVTYTDGWTMGVAKLCPTTFSTLYTHYLAAPACARPAISYGHGKYDGREKNWAPFVSDDGRYLCYIYNDNPRTVLMYEDTGNQLTFRYLTVCPNELTWTFGTVRGGTPAIPFRGSTEEVGLLLAFFHSSHIQQNAVVYHVGAYVFEPVPPFRILKQTMVPLLSGEKSVGDRSPGLYAHPYVVFPGGAVQSIDGESFVLSLGINDVNVGLLTIPRSRLEDALVPVNAK
jgi:hypothetical protein